MQTTEPLSLFLLGELNVNNKMKTAFVRIYIFINNELKIIPWYVYTVKQWIQ